jgi:ketosteroid isomerase-like protein
MSIVSPDVARHFAQSWIEGWNNHDLDAILSHYADDFELASPLIAPIAKEASGVLCGKAAVRAYWEKALEQIPNLHFDLQAVLAGVNSVTLYYRGHQGMVAEVLMFNRTGKVKKALACYAISP